MYQVTRATYRLAQTDDEIPAGSIVTILDKPGAATVVVRRGHATQRLLDALTQADTERLMRGEWLRQQPGDTDAPIPTIDRAVWEFVPADRLPHGLCCLPIERHREHVWLIREGEASPELVAEMSRRLTQLVQAGVWARFGAENRCG